MSKKAEKFRERAEQHRTLAKLYDRRAAKAELADNLETYKAQLADNAKELEELAVSCTELERELQKPAEEAASVRT